MQVYLRHTPKRAAVPVVVSLPHSGLYVPPEIDRQFVEQHRRWLRNTDWYLPDVYAFLPELGVTMIEATHSRYVVDLNRDPHGNLHGRSASSVIPRETVHGAQIYTDPQDPLALLPRLAAFHAPYHAAVRAALDETLERFDRALLLDLHSFMGPSVNDICLGSRWGTTCFESTTHAFHAAFVDHAFDVVRDEPFAGGYIVRSYASPPSIEALQIELRYTTYLNCTNIDQPVRPAFESRRVAEVQARLRPALESAITTFMNNG